MKESLTFFESASILSIVVFSNPRQRLTLFHLEARERHSMYRVLMSLSSDVVACVVIVRGVVAWERNGGNHYNYNNYPI